MEKNKILDSYLNMKVNLFYIQFQNEILDREIELFRGAILSQVSPSLILFHNHKEEGYRYSYPLIQYKRLKGKAFIVCLSQGVETIGNLFSMSDFHFQLGERSLKMEVGSVWTQQVLVQVWNSYFVYRLNKWLPLNEKNYQEYQTLEGIAEQTLFLEKKLIGNILSFTKGIGLYVEQQVSCKILSIDSVYWSTYKGVRMKTFNIVFKTNISLPEYIGLGKGASIGHGTLFQIEKTSQD